MEEIKEAKERAETFLNNVIKQKWDISVLSFKPKLTFPFDHSEEGWDWPIRFEAYSYLGHRHRERIPDFATELRTLWNKWIELDNMAPFLKREKIFWPPVQDIVDYDKPDQRAWKFFGNEIESHISMFRAREVLGLVGYNVYFKEAKNRIIKILFSVPDVSLSIDDVRIIWQIVRSRRLKLELSSYLKTFAEEIITKHIDERVSFNVGRSVKPPRSYFFLKLWTTFFLCFGDFGYKFFDYAKKISNELIDKQKSDGSFNDSLLETFLSASIIHATKVDPFSDTVCKGAIEYILGEQKKEGYWRFLSGWSLLQDTTAFDVLSTVVVLETLDLITDDEPLPIWVPKKEAVLISDRKTKKDKTIMQFPTPKGTTWDKVTFCFLSNKAAELEAGDEREGKQFTEIGLEDDRNLKSNILCLVLASFGKYGEISGKIPGLHLRVNKNLKSHVYRLKKLLIDIFNIEKGSPFKYSKKTNTYTTTFKVKLKNDEIYDDIFDDFEMKCDLPHQKKY